MAEHMDMISSLPDDVLTHILSFVSTKKAIRTSKLSKRWRPLWASVPTLRFDFEELSQDKGDQEDEDDEEDHDEEDDEESDDVFGRILNDVLKKRKRIAMERGCMDELVTFEFSWNSGYAHDGLSSLKWLERVVALMPRVISIHIYHSSVNELILPDSLFSCASIHKLFLDIYNNFSGKPTITPELVDLPSLKVLELKMEDLSDNFIKKLFLGCPVLETLILRDCSLGISDITSDVLKEIYMDNCDLFEKLRFSCPSLVSLSINDSHLFDDILLENMKSLTNVVIELAIGRYYETPDHPPTVNVLSGLSSATTIKLHFSPCLLKELMCTDGPKCRTFNNLKSLELKDWDITNEFHLVACFLENSPNLQELTLHPFENNDSDRDTEVLAANEALGDVLFQREYLAICKIICDSAEIFVIASKF